MRAFCYELEQGSHHDQLPKYHQTIKAIANWYKESYQKYEKMFQTELGIQLMSKQLQENLELVCFADDLSYTFDAKLAYFSVSDTLVKLLLSCFSYGRTQQFLDTYGISGKPNDDSWLKDTLNELYLTEILSKVLRDNKIAYSFDLAALLNDRKQRNNIAHASEREACLSAIRVYHSIRAMLIFLDDTYINELPSFSYGIGQELEYITHMSFDKLLAAPCNFNFDDSITILIAGSVHDVRSDFRQAVANLAWDLVIDYDGYSDCGGLLSSVEHNQLQTEILTYPVACSNQIISRGMTLWYRCGEYQIPSFFPQGGSIQINEYTYFHKSSPYIKNNQLKEKDKLLNLRGILEKLLEKANRLDRPINIIAAIDDEQIYRQILEACERVAIDDYFLTAIGVTSLNTDNLCMERFAGDKSDMEQHFMYCPVPVVSFYQSVAAYKNTLRSRVKVNTDFSVPGGDGKVVLTENNRTNIASYFDILYDGCEQFNNQEAEKQKQNFYRGNQASWYVIANHFAIPLKKNSDYKKILQKIRTALGVTQQKPQQRLLFLRHKAGLGGSTLVRQLGWDLHKDYTVLSARYYEPNYVKQLIENLYDNVLQKAPIVIIADDTLPSLRGLCDDICRTDRRCILIIACRENSYIIQEYPDAQIEYFSVLEDEVIPKLQAHFRSQSPLPLVKLQTRDSEFYTQISSTLRTPFIIGLYYMEDEFNINSYVKKALDGCVEYRYAEIIACIALCDKYNSKIVPVSLIKSALSLKAKDNFLFLVPAAATVISQSFIDAEVPAYYFTHSLLSQCYLEEYCRKYYHSDDQRDMLFNLVKKMIDIVGEMNKNNRLQEQHIDILITILIQNGKVAGVNDLNLSALLYDIGMKERQRELLLYLAEKFQDRADEIKRSVSQQGDIYLKRIERLILRLTSHAFSHLGRMYSRLEKNPAVAETYFERAIYYMPDNDPNIYHMAGISLLDKLKQAWNNDNELSKEELEQKYLSYELDIKLACEQFDKCCYYGSPDYGFPGKLDLLLSYLRFVYRTKGISSVEDFVKLSKELQRLRLFFMETLVEANTLKSLDKTAKQRIQEYEHRFYSDIILGNYGKSIEYYQNLVDKLRNRLNISIGDWEVALKGLIYARIAMARSKLQKPSKHIRNLRSVFYEVSNPQGLQDYISELLDQPLRVELVYNEYSTRTTLYYYWMQLAKIVGCSVETGLIRAKQWLEMEDLFQQKGDRNPDPYYYLQVLYYLQAREGSQQALSNAKALNRKIDQLAGEGRFDSRKGNIRIIRDIFVEGKGMSQLFDVSFCRTEEEMLSAISNAKVQIIELHGHLDTFLNRSNALITVYSPGYWNGMDVRVEIGRGTQNSLTEKQQGHKVVFYAGCSISYVCALSDTLKDLSAKETFNAFEK